MRGIQPEGQSRRGSFAWRRYIVPRYNAGLDPREGVAVEHVAGAEVQGFTFLPAAKFTALPLRGMDQGSFF